MSLLLSSVLFAVLVPQEPVRIGLLVPDLATAEEQAFVRGARRAEAAIARQGGVDGAALELVFAAASAPGDVAGAIGDLQAANVVAVVAPPEPYLADTVRRVAGKLPCVVHVAGPDVVAKALDDVCNHTFCMQYIGLVRDGSREARAFERLLGKDGLTAPTELLWDIGVGASAKTFGKQMEKSRPHLLVVDAEPDAAAQFLTEVLGSDPIPVVLTPRAVGPATRALPRTSFAVLGLSAASVATTTPFRTDYEFEYGDMGYGAAEGYEGVFAVARAVDAADARDAAAVKRALLDVVVEGARGRTTFDKAEGGLSMPCAVWLLEGGAIRHYAPGIVPLVAAGASPGTSAGPAVASGPGPQEQIGEPFGTWRTRQFVFEEGAQWVLCQWTEATDPGFATSGEDLRLLGLSTEGVDAIADHLVREEILARVLAIVSTKFGRAEDGTGIPGKSLRISFAAHVDRKEREKKKQRLWPAYFGGDHSGAGGEAFGTYCRVYTAFIRRTIFQAHALTPPLESADRAYLDGSYVFGSDRARDKRSELIRALINGYAGSMALTLAHEVGHLAGLGHVTDDPVEIMNVDEGAGIDYRDAHFGPGTWAIMERRYGLTEANGRKVPRPISR